MSLISAKEVAKVIKVDKYRFIGTFIGWILMKILRISKLNAVYKKYQHLDAENFVKSVLDELEIKFDIPEEDLKRIPKEGAFITVSNHPLGGVDGLLLLHLMLNQRKDFKIIANFLLQKLKPLESKVLPVNPFESHKNAHSSIVGFKNALSHLHAGCPLGIFPAGEVSTYREGKLIVDKPWEEAAIKLTKKAGVPVVPIYFHAKNSRTFYLLSQLSDTLRTALLPSELFQQKRRTISVRIGKPISVKSQDEVESLAAYSGFLRRKTYLLAKPFEKNRFNLKNKLKIPKPPKKIIKPINPSDIVKEVEVIRALGTRLLVSRNFEVFLAESYQIPNCLREIGRLREITFREIGEGTNQSIDLDAFDTYYYHMFLWDNDAQKIVGAYRMGLGSEIFAKYGINGFYTQDLFRYEPELYQMMSQTIEMGRAFIVSEYQQKPMPLFLLWRGIIHTALRHPEHKYLMGGVSISNQFSNFSKSLMIQFMKSHYYDPYIAQYVHPKKEFKVKLADEDKDFVLDATEADLNKFDRFIDELEPGALRLPVLLKKYIKQNARLIAFNVDPLFNDAVDGLMYIRISDLPEETMKPVMEEFQRELEQKLQEGKDISNLGDDLMPGA
ncbi:MAG: lysophospholipid acyltransferase family protein [Bacteroidetes bacterium]|nr:lysophospholipid acyltransferase family protein [Bacteroidota bacterium]